MTEEKLRIFTYVILGMTLGVILAAIVMDIKFSSTVEESTVEENKENHHHESNTSGIELSARNGA